MSIEESTNYQVEKNTKKVKESLARKKFVQLPLSRVKTIMKMSNEVQNVSQDGLLLVTRATELFIQYLAHQTKIREGQKMDYNKLANIVQGNESLVFLRKYLPKKITFKKFKEIMTSKEDKDELVIQNNDLPNNYIFDCSSEDDGDEIINLSPSITED